MSTALQPLPRTLQDQEVLGELLHSISQPLTSLRCSLELSIEGVAGRQQESVSAALEQAETVIGMVRLMREYLDAELGAAPLRAVALAPVLSTVVEELSSVAAARQVRLQLTGTSAGCIPVAETRLRLALQYLITALIERQPAVIALRLDESRAESLLCAQVSGHSLISLPPQQDSVGVTLRRVRLAVASRVFENAGATLIFGDGRQSAFVLRIPKNIAPAIS